MKIPDQWPCHFRALAGIKPGTMYKYTYIPDLQKTSQAAVTAEVYRYGVSVFVESDPDWCGPDIYIDPQDEAGIAIFREFCEKMAVHYRKLTHS